MPETNKFLTKMGSGAIFTEMRYIRDDDVGVGFPNPENEEGEETSPLQPEPEPEPDPIIEIIETTTPAD